jgi:hypothetical protein
MGGATTTVWQRAAIAATRTVAVNVMGSSPSQQEINQKSAQRLWYSHTPLRDQQAAIDRSVAQFVTRQNAAQTTDVRS